MNYFQSISSSIKTKLAEVGGIKAVYEYEPDKPASGAYPFATVTPAGFSGEFGDTIRNVRSLNFTVRIYQERTTVGFGNEKAERVMRELLDEVTTAFDMDTTLSGMVKFIRPLSGSVEYVEREAGDTRMAEVILEAVVVVPSVT